MAALKLITMAEAVRGRRDCDCGCVFAEVGSVGCAHAVAREQLLSACLQLAGARISDELPAAGSALDCP
eukprot:7366159-Karenia_brevis.AAC.1